MNLNIRDKFNISEKREEELSNYVDNLMLAKYERGVGMADALALILGDSRLAKEEKIIVAYMYGVVNAPDIFDKLGKTG